LESGIGEFLFSDDFSSGDQAISLLKIHKEVRSCPLSEFFFGLFIHINPAVSIATLSSALVNNERMVRQITSG